METLSYIKGTEEEIIIGNTYYFGQLWDGNGDGKELLESEAISLDNENVIQFKAIETMEQIMDTLVIVTDIL